MSEQAWFAEVLAALVARRDLSRAQVRAALGAMMAGRCGEAEAAAFLVALRMKGESAEEIAAAAEVLREHMVRWEPGCERVLDTCGTGGDGTGTFNISTATALVVAGAGVRVVKHGNRSVSSRSGSADVLTALGVRVEGDGAFARLCLERAGLAFCFAPHFHPALRHIAPVRRRLGIGTLFNCLGPLANPAGAAYQLLGVGRPELLDLMAGALARLGTGRALVVCGRDGLDEVSLTAPTLVREVCGHTVRAWEWTAADFGLAPCALADLRADGPEASAALVQAVLDGADGPAMRVVLANSAAALVAAEHVDTLAQGVTLARAALTSGKARAVLARLVDCSRCS
ncbi:MAG: anthranilate phosphoribosyltransferase [Gemmataceae bacterium]|nr:anthranilate phosphoribosyltransferase [Gemmataceae bacterium]